MKKLFLVLVYQFMFFAIIIGQTEDKEHFSQKNALKLSPFELGQSEFQLTYERYIGENRRASFLLIPSVHLKDTREESIGGWQVMGQYRFYLTHFRKDQKKTFLNLHNYGFYTGLYALYLNYEQEYSRGFFNPNNGNYDTARFNKSISGLEGGALIGLQVDITSRILMDFYVGGGIRKAETDDSYFDEPREGEYYESYHVFDLEYTGVKPRLGFSIGILF